MVYQTYYSREVISPVSKRNIHHIRLSRLLYEIICLRLLYKLTTVLQYAGTSVRPTNIGAVMS